MDMIQSFPRLLRRTDFSNMRDFLQHVEQYSEYQELLEKVEEAKSKMSIHINEQKETDNESSVCVEEPYNIDEETKDFEQISPIKYVDTEVKYSDEWINSQIEIDINQHKVGYKCKECGTKIKLERHFIRHVKSHENKGGKKGTKTIIEKQLYQAKLREESGNEEETRIILKQLADTFSKQKKVLKEFAYFEARTGNYKLAFMLLKEAYTIQSNPVPIQDMIPCDQCSRKMSNKYSLARHIRDMHSKSVTCEKCSAKFKDMHTLRQNHPCAFTCKKPNCKFMSVHKYRMEKHYRQKHVKCESLSDI